MVDLAIYVLTWKRPAFLARTLTSIVQQIAAEPDRSISLNVVNNGTDSESRAVLEQFASSLDSVLLLKENLGLSRAYDRAIPNPLPAQCIMVSEDDMEYRLPFGRYVDLLTERSDVGAATGYMAPEHPARGWLVHGDRRWLLKRMSVATHIVMRTDVFQSFRPFDINHWANFDIHLFAEAPNSLQKQGLPIAVLPGGAIHFGLGSSTWTEDSGRRPELTDNQLQELIDASLMTSDEQPT